jgi:hypothetical protein
MEKNTKRITYYKVTERKEQFAGQRYFKFDMDSESVLQVCYKPSFEVRRGKSNNIGAYVISRMTFLSNWFAMNYVEPITKAQFDKKYNEMFKMLN